MEKITSRRNIKCLHVKNLGKSKEYRDEHKEFICDGRKLLEEAVKSIIHITNVFTMAEINIKLPKETPVYIIDESIMDTLSPLKSSQDILFTCKMPDNNKHDLTTGIHILLDNVQDPGNVGTIIRSADSFGIDSVLLTDDCADLYNPKTIRATMGAIFRQKVTTININDLKVSGVRIVGTDSKSDDCVDIKKAVLKNTVVILGNEGQGLSHELRKLCDEMITIPLSPGSESLNVAIAASIIMWEAKGR